MTNQRGLVSQSVVGCALLLLAGCGSGSGGGGSSGASQGGQSSTGGTGSGGVSSWGTGGTSFASSTGGAQVGGAAASGGQSSGATGGQATGGTTGGQAGSTASGGQVSAGSGGTTGGQAGGGSGGATGGQETGGTGGGSQAGTAGSGGRLGTGGRSSGGRGGATTSGGTAGTGGGEQSGGSGGQGGSTATGGQTGSTGGSGGVASSCVGNPVPTANPAAKGPFQVAADKNVGPLAGVVPDPVYGDEQQRFNVYRPANLADSGYCHPILIWANGYTDNPEPNPPKCVLDSGANKWCGQYKPLLEHLASHGFVVVASLSTATAEGDPLPTIAGMDWIIEQAEDSSSPYYHHLDTANIGQLGHSYGGMSTCMSASDPRYKALATICGTRALTGVHTPMLFYCGGKDTTVKCSGVRDVFLTVKDQPAFFIDELASDHGWWVYQGAGGVSLSMAAAWFRVHLMNDTANRNYFYGSNCKFCTDSRVQVEQNSLMAE
jgi:hypothetical protein